jgi:sphinganine-1-phosphate aldolase
MTSGGTESILSAVKASRDYMAQRRGITHPEMVIGESAHAAFFKAAEYFKIRLIKVTRPTCTYMFTVNMAPVPI